MSKDHKPDTFHRPSGYMSDFENLQADPQAKKVNYNTANGSLNFYVKTDRGHHHVFYEPKRGRSGLHFDGHPTKNNHPKDLQPQTNPKEEANMASNQEFRNSQKVNYSLAAQNADAKAFAAKAQAQPKAVKDSGGREIGEESGPAKGGRENGNKVGAMRASIKSAPSKGKTANGKTASNGKGGPNGKGGSGGKGGPGGKGGGGKGGHGGSGGKGGGGKGK